MYLNLEIKYVGSKHGIPGLPKNENTKSIRYSVVEKRVAAEKKLAIFGLSFVKQSFEFRYF